MRRVRCLQLQNNFPSGIHGRVSERRILLCVLYNVGNKMIMCSSREQHHKTTKNTKSYLEVYRQPLNILVHTRRALYLNHSKKISFVYFYLCVRVYMLGTRHTFIRRVSATFGHLEHIFLCRCLKSVPDRQSQLPNQDTRTHKGKVKKIQLFHKKQKSCLCLFSQTPNFKIFWCL